MGSKRKPSPIRQVDNRAREIAQREAQAKEQERQRQAREEQQRQERQRQAKAEAEAEAERKQKTVYGNETPEQVQAREEQTLKNPRRARRRGRRSLVSGSVLGVKTDGGL